MNFEKVMGGLDMRPLQRQLARYPQLWDEFNVRRTFPGSPHAEMTDIWARYNDPAPYIASGDWTGFDAPHASAWLPPSSKLPAIKAIAERIREMARGTAIGGVLLTKLPAGGRISRHTDAGWHAGYYDKFYVAVNAPQGARFCWDDGAIKPSQGDVWWFRNDVPHWVENDSPEDRLAAIVCIRTSLWRTR